MIADQYGQLYPRVDSEKCTDCSLCSMVCCQEKTVKQRMPIETIAASYKNRSISAKSSSGGIFAALAENVLSEGGIVYGTYFSDHFEALVVGIESMDDLFCI